MFVTDAIEHGAKKSKLARVWGISRQTIHNYSEKRLSTKECAIAILNRWGASENTLSWGA